MTNSSSYYNSGIFMWQENKCISWASEDRQSTDSTESSSSSRDKVRSNLANGSNLLLAQWQTNGPVTSHTTAAPGSDKSSLTLHGVKRKGQQVCLFVFFFALFFFFVSLKKKASRQ